MDLIDDGPDAPSNAPEYNVSEISGAVKRTLEDSFGRIRVRGEVGRVFRARSGHLYFDLKDDRSVLASVCWKGQIARLQQVPEEGMEVVATGRLTTFGSQSKYQLTVDEVAPAGVGALMAMLEKRRAALEAEGLFATERKRPLPYLPDVIGVVTSPGGAVIRDILHRLADRFPRHVLVWPVAVQGRDCAPQVARAIAGFNRLAPGGPVPRPDVLIVARGGGSIEDLWGFNEEAVVRAAAESAIPLISAVGHETDTTLIDHASDQRAPTPTAAAEMAVPVRRDLIAEVQAREARLTAAASRSLTRRAERLADLSRALPRSQSLVEGPRQRLDFAAERLPSALRAGLQRRRLDVTRASGALRPQSLAARLQATSDRLAALETRLGQAAEAQMRQARRDSERLGVRLQPVLLKAGLSRRQRDLGTALRRLALAAETQQRRATARLDALGRVLGSLGYQETLRRGFTVVWAGEAVVTSKAAAEATSAPLVAQFHDGRLEIGEVGKAGPDHKQTGKRKPAKPRRPGPEPGDQGQLF